MLLAENYQNWSMLVEATACQSWCVLRHIVVIKLHVLEMLAVK